MIRHVLLYKFRPSATEEERGTAFEMLTALGRSVPEVREWSVGRQAFPSPKAYDLAQVSGFDDIASLGRYRAHDEHNRTRDFIAQIADWVVVDYELPVPFIKPPARG
jgi:hypothetical protein